MINFDPSDNTMVAAYGPPEYFEPDPAEESTEGENTGSDSVIGKILALLQKLIDFIKNLFR